MIGNQDINIICPIHTMPMILREKTNTEVDNILDHYYLRCPHLKCEQTRKLKDFAQLVSYLKRNTGEGIFT